MGTAGLVDAPTVKFTGLNANAKAGNPEYKVNYTPSAYSMTANNFLSYMRSRKEYKTITSLDQITASGIYLYENEASTLNLTSVPSQFNNYNVVLVFDQGEITVDASSFNPTKSIALVTDTIKFSTTSAEATGLFIANTIETGTTTNLGLKINGNLISQISFENERRWSNQKRPSLFVAFEPNLYLDLLPYLSIANYEWRQLQ